MNKAKSWCRSEACTALARQGTTGSLKQVLIDRPLQADFFESRAAKINRFERRHFTFEARRVLIKLQRTFIAQQDPERDLRAAFFFQAVARAIPQNQSSSL